MTVYEKLLAVQTELKAPKSQFNSFGKYNYRNVEDILEAVKPLCEKQKALIYLTDTVVYIEGRFYLQAQANFVDAESGEKVTVTGYAREDDSKKGMDGSQITGASSSYARKYALGGLLDVDDGKDSDSLPPDSENSTPPVLCADCGCKIKPSRKKDGTRWLVPDIVAYGDKRFGRALCDKCLSSAFRAEQ